MARSVAPTRLDHHVLVLLENHVGVVVEVEDHNGRQFGGRAARLRNIVGVHQMDQSLDDGVIGGVHVRVQRETALPVAEEGGVTVRCYDPVLPTQVFEADVERPLLATPS